jgi:ethanolamine utilization protein EutA (predicted chaperonin)
LLDVGGSTGVVSGHLAESFGVLPTVLDPSGDELREATALGLETIGLPIVLLIDGDVGNSLGRIICNEVVPGAHVIALDGVQLKQFDYVDIGGVIELTNAVPVIIKSLLFK